MKHIHDGNYCYWCTDYMAGGTVCDRPEVIRTSEITKRMQDLHEKCKILESTIDSMDKVILGKDMYIKTLEAEIARFQRIIKSN